MGLQIYDDSRTIENMLKYLADKNKIKQFEFLIYRQDPIEGYDTFEQAASSEIRKRIKINPKRIPIISQIEKIDDEVIGISSKILCTGGLEKHLKHLDMDFVDSVSDDKEEIQTFLEKMHPIGEYEGLIILSGNGFHYYGGEVLPPNEWIDWIKRAKTPDTLVDPDWCEIQLERGYSILRMTSSSLKPNSPKVLYRVIKR